jgi:hypothetical protein
VPRGESPISAQENAATRAARLGLIYKVFARESAQHVYHLGWLTGPITRFLGLSSGFRFELKFAMTRSVNVAHVTLLCRLPLTSTKCNLLVETILQVNELRS